MTTSATARPTSTLPSTWAPERLLPAMDREVRRFLNLIDKAVPDHLAVHVVVDNSSTHKRPPSSGGSCATLASPCTSPTYSSWLNLVWALVCRASPPVAARGAPPSSRS